MRAKWYGYSDNKPARATTRVLQSGTDGLVLEDKQDGTIIDYVCPGLYHDKVELNGVVYDLLYAKDGYSSGPPGSPMLPTKGQFVAIPYSAELVSIQVVEVEIRQLDGRYNLPPHPEPSKEREPLVYRRDEAIYGRNSYYPDDWFMIMDECTVSDARVCHIIIYSAKYNPVSKRVIGLVNLSLRFIYNETDRPDRKRKARPDNCSSLVHDIARVLHYDNKRGRYI